MDARTVRPKVTTAKLTPSSATSRPSSRNSTRPPSRPASPTKSFVSTSSPLTSTITTRPKAKVNSSAIRRTPSTTTDSPVHTTRPSSPSKFTPRRDGALSPPSSAVGVGTRSKPVARAKASSSVSSVKTTKSPSPELRARSFTASSDTLRSNPAADSRKRQGSAASVLHHTSSQSNLQAPPPINVPPVPSLPPGALRLSRIAHLELGSATSDVEGVENLNEVSSSKPQPLKIRSKVTTMVKNLNDVSNSPSTIPIPEFSSPSTPSPTTSTSSASRPVKVHVRASSVSSTVSSPGAPAASPPTPNTLAYPITTSVPAANPHRYATPRSSLSGLRSSFSASSSPKYMSPAGTDDFRPFAKTSIFPPSPSSSSNNVNGVNGLNGFSYGRAMPSSPSVDLTNIPPPPQSPPISALSVSSRSSYSGNFTYDSGTSPESSDVSGGGPGPKKKRDSSSQDLRTTLDNLVAYASLRGDDDSPVNGSFGPRLTAEEDEKRKERAEAKSNRKIADLEITNRSLLAINASLEKTKDRQAKEIRELKRKLRETRLILPPRAYRAVKSSLDPSEIGDDEEDIDSDFSSDNDDDDEFHSADEGVSGVGISSGSDETYRRIKLIIENLLETGKKALEKTREDFMDIKGGAKVLTAEEVESWRDSGAGSSTIGRLSDSESHLDVMDDEDASSSGRLTRSHSPTPQPALSNGGVIRTDLRQPNFGLSPSSTATLLSSQKPPPILITETP